MKKTVIFAIAVMLLASSLNIALGAPNKKLRGKFSESDISGTNFKQITFTPYYSNEDTKDTYYIYLPSGYFIEGSSASYTADRNGSYPFTVYDGSNKETFVYKVKSIEETDKDNDEEIIPRDIKLMYDYEKKQILFNLQLNKAREVTTSKNTSFSNEINYYMGDIKNNIPYNLSFKIDGKSFNYKVVKSGEYYLLISVSPVNYDDYSTVVEYFGYNFTNNEVYTVTPPKDIYDDNGSYKVLVKSDKDQHIFNINIDDIDFRRPSVDWSFYDDKITIDAGDDFGLSYIIAYDGKYVPINGKEAEYHHPEEIIYNGEYIFVIADKNGNRTVKNAEIKTKRKLITSKTRHAINLDVHDFKYTDELFENKGIEYKKTEEVRIYENILPAYMNGKSSEKFSPDSSVTRAEMVTVFCRLNNLPYDGSSYLKSKFTDIGDHWARDYIAMGSSKKYVSGYKDKTFKPDNPVTRAEFCQMLTKISEYKSLLNNIPAYANKNYADLSKHWAEKEIIKISSRNLVTGDDINFYPDEPITRGDVVHAINTLYGFNPTDSELAYINSLYDKYYGFEDIDSHKHYDDIIISVVGMYREKLK